MLNIYRLEQQIAEDMGAANVPGLSLAVVEGNEVVYARGFGVTSLEDGGKSVTPETLFRIGSITKPHTGTAVMRLVDEGRLDLNAPVRLYLDWFTLSDEEMADRVTLRHLLSHTAGLPTEWTGFGGVMRLLGQLDWRGETANCPFCYYHTVIPLGPIGGPFAGTATATAYVGGTASAPTWVTATVWGFPWDTGTVRGVASLLGTTSATATSVMGADLRTPSGLGTLQLVTPFVVRVISSPPFCGGCENRYYYAGIAGADIRFVPEPSASAVLATGLGTLALLYRRSKRRRP